MSERQPERRLFDRRRGCQAQCRALRSGGRVDSPDAGQRRAGYRVAAESWLRSQRGCVTAAAGRVPEAAPDHGLRHTTLTPPVPTQASGEEAAQPLTTRRPHPPVMTQRGRCAGRDRGGAPGHQAAWPRRGQRNAMRARATPATRRRSPGATAPGPPPTTPRAQAPDPTQTLKPQPGGRRRSRQQRPSMTSSDRASGWKARPSRVRVRRLYGTVDQGDAQGLLETEDAGAEGGLREIHGAGSGGEPVIFDERDERCDLPDVERQQTRSVQPGPVSHGHSLVVGDPARVRQQSRFGHRYASTPPVPPHLDVRIRPCPKGRAESGCRLPVASGYLPPSLTEMTPRSG